MDDWESENDEEAIFRKDTIEQCAPAVYTETPEALADPMRVIKMDIRSILVTQQKPINVKEIENLYNECFDDDLPFKRYGCTSTLELLEKMNDCVMKGKSPAGETVYIVRNTESIADIHNQVLRQATPEQVAKRRARGRMMHLGLLRGGGPPRRASAYGMAFREVSKQPTSNKVEEGGVASRVLGMNIEKDVIKDMGPRCHERCERIAGYVRRYGTKKENGVVEMDLGILKDVYAAATGGLMLWGKIMPLRKLSSSMNQEEYANFWKIVTINDEKELYMVWVPETIDENGNYNRPERGDDIDEPEGCRLAQQARESFSKSEFGGVLGSAAKRMIKFNMDSALRSRGIESNLLCNRLPENNIDFRDRKVVLPIYDKQENGMDNDSKSVERIEYDSRPLWDIYTANTARKKDVISLTPCILLLYLGMTGSLKTWTSMRFIKYKAKHSDTVKPNRARTIPGTVRALRSSAEPGMMPKTSRFGDKCWDYDKLPDSVNSSENFATNNRPLFPPVLNLHTPEPSNITESAPVRPIFGTRGAPPGLSSFPNAARPRPDSVGSVASVGAQPKQVMEQTARTRLDSVESVASMSVQAKKVMEQMMFNLRSGDNNDEPEVDSMDETVVGNEEVIELIRRLSRDGKVSMRNLTEVQRRSVDYNPHLFTVKCESLLDEIGSVSLAKSGVRPEEVDTTGNNGRIRPATLADVSYLRHNECVTPDTQGYRRCGVLWWMDPSCVLLSDEAGNFDESPGRFNKVKSYMLDFMTIHGEKQTLPVPGGIVCAKMDSEYARFIVLGQGAAEHEVLLAGVDFYGLASMKWDSVLEVPSEFAIDHLITNVFLARVRAVRGFAETKNPYEIANEIVVRESELPCSVLIGIFAVYGKEKDSGLWMVDGLSDGERMLSDRLISDLGAQTREDADHPPIENILQANETLVKRGANDFDGNVGWTSEAHELDMQERQEEVEERVQDGAKNMEEAGDGRGSAVFVRVRPEREMRPDKRLPCVDDLPDSEVEDFSSNDVIQTGKAPETSMLPELAACHRNAKLSVQATMKQSIVLMLKTYKEVCDSEGKTDWNSEMVAIVQGLE